MVHTYRTLRVAPSDAGVLGLVIAAPPMNLIGPELVRDLVGLLGALESDPETRVVVLESADPDYFVPHVNLTEVAEYTAKAAKAGGPDDASLGMLWHKLSELPVITIAKIRGRARGAGSELALACDMRFAARENAILGQIEVGAGTLPGAGGVQHLARLLGRGRAMEAILGADDFGAEQAERYGWINRALPDADLDAFVARLARRIASFPAGAVRSAKRAQRADPAGRGRDPRQRPPVPTSWSPRTRPKTARSPCSRRASRPRPARARPRNLVTQKQIQRTAFGSSAAGADDQGLGQGRSRARRTDRIWRIAA
jgi:enoyl-CoA hydratase/carnithine racemase